MSMSIGDRLGVTVEEEIAPIIEMTSRSSSRRPRGCGRLSPICGLIMIKSERVLRWG
jgi:hypothetical protein